MDESGTLELPEFLTLLTREPWLEVIPIESRVDFVGAIDQLEKGHRGAAQQAMRVAQDLFEDADTDGSNTIDLVELRKLLSRLLGTEADFKEVQRSMMQFDVDRSSSLSFTEVPIV